MPQCIVKMISRKKTVQIYIKLSLLSGAVVFRDRQNKNTPICQFHKTAKFRECLSVSKTPIYLLFAQYVVKIPLINNV